MRKFLIIFFGFFFVLAACNGQAPALPVEVSGAASPAVTSAAPPAAAPSASVQSLPAGPQGTSTGLAQSTPSATAPSQDTETTRLLIWVPPFLSPVSENTTGSLLRKRLAEFQARFPNVIVETRVKAESGPGGLLDSLTTASAAAPASLPDLVALPRELEEAAALKGLLLPLDNLTSSLDDPDWYPYALELAHLQNNVYGFPFAGDALVQVYHTDLVTDTLKSWSSVVQSGQPLLFPAASENAFFTLASYQAVGGKPRDEQGRPTLAVPELSRVLDFYQQSVQSGVMPAALLTQLQNDQAAWEAFESGQGQVVITWSSRYLQNPVTRQAISQIPGPQGKSYTLATGWVWALVGRDEEKRRLAVDLAEFLTESQFLSDWTLSMGYLPPRPGSLDLWSDQELAHSVAEIATEAVLLPPTDVLAALEVHLQQATLAVLKSQSDPSSAAEQASASLTSP